MSKSKLEGKVGLFVFVCLVLLGGLVLQFSKGAKLFEKTYDITLDAANVGGLKNRAKVLMSGVEVGLVSNIRLSKHGTNALVTLHLYKEYEVHQDAEFAIESAGFLGDQYIAITPRANLLPPFTNGGIAHAEAPFNIQEAARSATGLLQRIDDAAVKLNAMLADVRRDLLNDRTLTNLSAALANLRNVSDHALTTVDSLNRLIVTNEAPISLAVSNFSRFGEQLNAVAGSAGEVLNTNAPQINLAIKNLEDSTEKLKHLLDDVQAGHGLAGSLLKNDQLASDVNQIAANLNVATENLNRRGLWGLLWGAKPPRTNELSAQPLYPPKH